MSLTLGLMVIGPVYLNLICDLSRRLVHSVFMALLGVLRHHNANSSSCMSDLSLKKHPDFYLACP